MEINYYELLEIQKNADKESIKKAYRKLALKYHPDRNQGDSEAEAKFKLINEAYEVLSDDEKKAIYDRYGKEGLKGRVGGGFSDFAFDDLGDIFSSFFGGGFSNSRTSKRKRKDDKYEADFALSLNISFKEAVFGSEQKLNLRYKSPCPKCKGSGSKDGKTQTCTKCEGKGQVGVRQGFMTFVQTCPDCHGEGLMIKDKCQECRGEGYEELSEEVQVKIPEGIDDGMSLRVSSKGNILKDGSRGDVFVQVSVEEDETFIRDEDDIYIKFPVFFTQAALGQKIQVPTIRGQAEIELPIGAKEGQAFVLQNEGVKNLRSGKLGRQIVQIELVFPQSLSEEQSLLLEKLGESFGIKDGVHHEQKGFFDKIASWFK